MGCKIVLPGSKVRSCSSYSLNMSSSNSFIRSLKTCNFPLSRNFKQGIKSLMNPLPITSMPVCMLFMNRCSHGSSKPNLKRNNLAAYETFCFTFPVQRNRKLLKTKQEDIQFIRALCSILRDIVMSEIEFSVLV